MGWGVLFYLVGRQQPDDVVTYPVGAVVFDLGHLALSLGPVAREADHAPLGKTAVDRLGCDHPADLVYRTVHVVDQPPGGATVTEPGISLDAGHQLPDTPSTVASRSPETADVTLYHHYGERRVPLGQVVGRPKSGEPAPHDGHIRLAIAVECGAGFETSREGRQPQRKVGVIHHRWKYMILS